MSEEEEKPFKVVDKRRFTSEGTVRSDAPDDVKSTSPAPAAAPSAPRQDPRQASGGTRNAQAPAPSQSSIDFMSFAMSLATNALAAMGALPPEQSHGLPVNRDLAREYIDILTMLQEKTQGNLTPQEDQAFRRLVTELKMQFVGAARAPAGR